jgi:hypothetical protein
VFTAEEAAASAAMCTPREFGSPIASNSQHGEEGAIPPGNFLATMEFSVTDPATPATVKARLPLMQARRQLPFSGTAGTPKRKKPSSSHKKGAKSAGGSLAGDSTNSDDDQMAVSKSSRKNVRDTLAVEVAALKEQLSKVQMELLNRQLETVQIVASVKSDLTQLHNRLQLYQEAHANLEGVVDRTTSRVSNNEASISDIHSKLSATDCKKNRRSSERHWSPSEPCPQCLPTQGRTAHLLLTIQRSSWVAYHSYGPRWSFDLKPIPWRLFLQCSGTYRCIAPWTGSSLLTPRRPAGWTPELWLSTCGLSFTSGRL